MRRPKNSLVALGEETHEVARLALAGHGSEHIGSGTFRANNLYNTRGEGFLTVSTKDEEIWTQRARAQGKEEEKKRAGSTARSGRQQG